MAYEDVYNNFRRKFEIKDGTICDYRPCCEMYGVPSLPNAIVVFLKDGSKVVYIENPANPELIGE